MNSTFCSRSRSDAAAERCTAVRGQPLSGQLAPGVTPEPVRFVWSVFCWCGRMQWRARSLDHCIFCAPRFTEGALNSTLLSVLCVKSASLAVLCPPRGSVALCRGRVGDGSEASSRYQSRAVLCRLGSEGSWDARDLDRAMQSWVWKDSFLRLVLACVVFHMLLW